MRVAAVFCIAVSLAWSQSKPDVGSEPSPMEAFASQTEVRTTWSSEVANLGKDATKVVLTAVVLESANSKMRGLKIELSIGSAHDTIYLDEEATERTRSALIQIAGDTRLGLARNACMGAKEFWPLYDWPWNKYHELNADVCGQNSALVLYGRGRRVSYPLPGESATAVAGILARALADLKEH